MDQQPSLVPLEMWQFPMLRGMPAQLQSMVVEESGGVAVEPSAGSRSRRKRKDSSASAVGGSELVSTSSGNDLTCTNGKRIKVSKSTIENDNVKNEANANSDGSDGCNKLADQNPQSSEPPKQDYIHVRARRGQATDSHSLAERARREKISERMNILQDLVPGCNKVIGKASVLDEIINYIQALQRQVEFLSMKLEAVNSRINSGIEVFAPKEFGAQAYVSAPGLAFSSQGQAAKEYEQGPGTDWLHMQVGGAFERVT